MDQPREHVPPHIIGAQRIGPCAAILPCRRGQDRIAILFKGTVGRDNIGKDGHQGDEEDEIESHHRPLVFIEVLPELDQRVGRRLGGLGGIVGDGGGRHDRFLSVVPDARIDDAVHDVDEHVDQYDQ